MLLTTLILKEEISVSLSFFLLPLPSEEGDGHASHSSRMSEEGTSPLPEEREFPAPRSPNDSKMGEMLPRVLWEMRPGSWDQHRQGFQAGTPTPQATRAPFGAATWGRVNAGALEQGKAK